LYYILDFVNKKKALHFAFSRDAGQRTLEMQKLHKLHGYTKLHFLGNKV